MIAFPDTSFLCALYRPQHNSQEAAECFKSLPEGLHVTTLLLYEFRQSVRFQVWLHARDKNKGFSRADCDRALADLQADLDHGALIVVPAEWPDVFRLAEGFSKRHTAVSGHRSLDVLHVATAVHLAAKEFLTFDANQSRLAASEKLKVRP